MNKKFEDIIKSFKPEFGNMNHIQVLEMITKLRKKENLLKEKLTNQSAINKSLKEISTIEKNILSLIK